MIVGSVLGMSRLLPTLKSSDPSLPIIANIKDNLDVRFGPLYMAL